MKTFQINAVYGIGSTGTITKDLHELALEQGIESYVAYSASNIALEQVKNGYKVGTTFGNKLHAFLYRINGRQGYYSRFSTSRLIKYIKKIKPDIVSLHNLHSNYINLNLLLKFLAEENIKTVITLHDCWFYTGGCYHYTETGCQKWKSECGTCPKRKTDLKAYVKEHSKDVLQDRIRYFNSIPDLTVLGVSDWVTEEAKASQINAKRYLTVKNGIDTDFWINTESDFKKKHNISDKFMILGLASKFFNPINFDTLDQVVNSLDNDDCLVLIGCNDEQLKNLPNGVIGLPFISDREELRNIYSAADVFANCSREETLSMATVEAESCGTPAVVYENTGIKETVKNGDTGYVVKNGDSVAFAEGIKKIKEIGKSSFSENCCEWTAENFNRNNNYEKVLELYKSIIS